jgi:hypothetical protein
MRHLNNLFAVATIGGLMVWPQASSASPLTGGVASGLAIPELSEGLVQKVHGWHCGKRKGWYHHKRVWHRHSRACHRRYYRQYYYDDDYYDDDYYGYYDPGDYDYGYYRPYRYRYPGPFIGFGFGKSWDWDD